MEGLLRDMRPHGSSRPARPRPAARRRPRQSAPGSGTAARAIAVDHRQHALRQIAEIVGEVAVEPADHGAMRKIAVAAERQLAQQEIAHRIEPVFVDQLLRRDEVAERFRHLLAFDGPPAMGEDAARRFEPGGHQKGRPVDRVKAQNILTDHVKIGGPIRLKTRIFGIRIAERGDVVDRARRATHR